MKVLVFLYFTKKRLFIVIENKNLNLQYSACLIKD